MAPRPKLLAAAFICIAALAGAAAGLLWRRVAPAVVLADGEYLTPHRRLPQFSLIDHRGRSFGSTELRGHWSILFFGYTHCPDFCPTTLTTLAALEKRLRAAHAASIPQVVFVSVDAHRDTPQQLAAYVPYFDPGFLGVTATSQAAVEHVAQQLGVAVIISPQPGGDYTVDHSNQLLIIDPNGHLAAVLSGPFTVTSLQEDFERIVAGPA